MTSTVVPVFTFASPINHHSAHEVADGTSGQEWTEAAAGANAFTTDSVLRVHELRADKANSAGTAPGMVKTQQLLVSNGPYSGTTADAWDDTSTTRVSTFNEATADTAAALVVRGGGARIGGGLRVQAGNLNVTGAITGTSLSTGSGSISGGAVSGTTGTFTGNVKRGNDVFCYFTTSTVASTNTITTWTSRLSSTNFDSSTGTYTAPVAGVYRFTLSAIQDSSASTAQIFLRVNGADLSPRVQMFYSNTSSNVYSGGTSYTHCLTLAANAQVTFVVIGGSIYSSASPYIVLSGELVSPS